MWRTSFPDFHAEVDLELLRHGWAVGYIECLDMLGSDAALDLMDQFYAQMTEQRGFARRPALEAVSRGGLHAYRYAARHPDRVACIYADTPVMDLKSWPLGWPGATKETADALKFYGFKDEAELRAYRGNPVDVLAPIARAKIPLRHVISLNDRVVPPEQNTLEAQRRLNQLGHAMELVTVAEGTAASSGHHFPLPEVFASARFIMRHTWVLPDGQEYFALRNGLENSRAKFEREKTGRVAFLGGSITFNPGWRDAVMRYLEPRFPGNEVRLHRRGHSVAGLRAARVPAGTGCAVARPARSVVRRSGGERPQLRRPAERGGAGVARDGRRRAPCAPGESADRHRRAALCPRSTPQDVGRRQGALHHRRPRARGGTIRVSVPEPLSRSQRPHRRGPVHLGRRFPRPASVALRTAGLRQQHHPPARRGLAADAPGEAHPLPPPLDPASYDRGRFGDVNTARILSGFTLDPQWRPADGKGTRGGLRQGSRFGGRDAGRGVRVHFEGTGVGLMITSGPDARTIAFRIDDRPEQTVNTATPWSQSLHLPWALVLDDTLPAGTHTVRVRLVDGALRVFHLLEN